MALPPQTDGESYPDYIYRLVSSGRIPPATADHALATYQGHLRSRGRPAGAPVAPTSRGSNNQGEGRREQDFLFNTLTPDELMQVTQDMGVGGSRVVASDSFTRPRGISSSDYRHAVGYPFPHHQVIPDVPVESGMREPAAPPSTMDEIYDDPNTSPEMRGIIDELRAETTGPLSFRTREEVRVDNATKRLESIEEAQRNLERNRGRMTAEEYKRKKKQLEARWNRAYDDTLTGERREKLLEERFNERQAEKASRREQVTQELARRSIARRIRRGASPSKLISGYNRGGADRGRYMDPAEFGYRRPQAAQAPDGSIVEGDDGKRRVQTGSDGEPKNVPVFETPAGEHIIDPSGISEQEFNEFYTIGDRQRTAELIYATNDPLSREQRSIDAARNAAALDDYINEEDRQAAMQELDARESRLHRQFLMSKGALLSNRDVSSDRDKKKKASDTETVTEKDLLDFVNEMREQNGETPFRTIREARNELRGTLDDLYQLLLEQRRAETTEYQPVPPPAGRGTEDRVARNIYQQFIDNMLSELRRSDPTLEPNRMLGQFFDGQRLTESGWFDLVERFEAFLKLRYPDLKPSASDLDNLMVHITEAYRRAEMGN